MIDKNGFNWSLCVHISHRRLSGEVLLKDVEGNEVHSETCSLRRAGSLPEQVISSMHGLLRQQTSRMIEEAGLQADRAEILANLSEFMKKVR